MNLLLGIIFISIGVYIFYKTLIEISRGNKLKTAKSRKNHLYKIFFAGDDSLKLDLKWNNDTNINVETKFVAIPDDKFLRIQGSLSFQKLLNQAFDLGEVFSKFQKIPFGIIFLTIIPLDFIDKNKESDINIKLEINSIGKQFLSFNTILKKETIIFSYTNNNLSILHEND